MALLSEDDAEIAEELRFHGAIAQLPSERQGLLVVVDGLLPLAQTVEDSAEVTEAYGFDEAVAQLPRQRQRPLVVVDSLPEVALAGKVGATAEKSPGLAIAVALTVSWGLVHHELLPVANPS